MSPAVAPFLALVLFLPWYLLLGWLFWRATASGQPVVARSAALGILLLSLAVAGGAGFWAFGHASDASGAIWKQVLACLVGYGAFLACLFLGACAIRALGRAD